MKQCICVKLAICALVVLSVSSAFAFQQPFSADSSTTSANGKIHMTGKVYVAMPKMRVDTNSAGTPTGHAAGPFGGNVIMIIDATAKMSYMLMPKQHMYMEFHADQNKALAPNMPKFQDMISGQPCAGRAEMTCKKLGTETVNGRSCEKWEMTDKNSKTTTMWLDQKLHFPIKTVTAEGMTSEYSNVKEGTQDAALFQVPAGYQKMDMSNMGRPPR